MACERNHQAGGRLGKIDSPRTLPTCEGGYKPFKIGELFDVKTPKKKFNANEIQFGGQYPYVARGVGNNGIRGYVTLDTQYLNEGNTLSFGQDTATIFYQTEPYFTGDKIKVLHFKRGVLDAHLACFLITSMRKAFANFSWGSSSFSEEVINNTLIYLPTTAAGDIDFAFIEERVRELEEERVRELEAYLKAAGFEDCALSTLERQALSLLSSGISTKYFKIRELFEKQSTIRLGIKVADVSKEKTNAADLPVLTAGIINQGLVGFIPRANATILKNVISVSANGANTGAMFYQPDEFTILQDSYAIGWRDTRRNVEECVYLYLVSCLQKSVRGYYDWSNKAGWEKIKGLTISLPITTDGAIDYAFMETSIRAMEKQCIARLKAAFVREHEAYMQVIF